MNNPSITMMASQLNTLASLRSTPSASASLRGMASTAMLRHSEGKASASYPEQSYDSVALAEFVREVYFGSHSWMRRRASSHLREKAQPGLSQGEPEQKKEYSYEEIPLLARVEFDGSVGIVLRKIVMNLAIQSESETSFDKQTYSTSESEKLIIVAKIRNDSVEAVLPREIDDVKAIDPNELLTCDNITVRRVAKEKFQLDVKDNLLNKIANGSYKQSTPEDNRTLLCNDVLNSYNVMSEQGIEAFLLAETLSKGDPVELLELFLKFLRFMKV